MIASRHSWKFVLLLILCSFSLATVELRADDSYIDGEWDHPTNPTYRTPDWLREKPIEPPGGLPRFTRVYRVTQTLSTSTLGLIAWVYFRDQLPVGPEVIPEAILRPFAYLGFPSLLLHPLGALVSTEEGWATSHMRWSLEHDREFLKRIGRRVHQEYHNTGIPEIVESCKAQLGRFVAPQNPN